MRLPQIRITTGNLLFLVFVAAVNLGLARHFYPRLAQGDSFDPDWSNTLELLVGLSPLINLAVIGILWFLAGAFRDRLSRRPIDQRKSFRGFTYFCVHFGVLGCLISYLMPRIFEDYLDYLQPVSRFTDETLARFAETKTHPDLSLFLDCFLLGVFLSGPPILAGWVGGMIARRCSSILPRRRFQILTVLITLGFAATAGAVAVTPQPFWERSIPVDLEFEVVDQESGEPIVGSFLRITEVFYDHDCARALTGPDGRARLTAKLVTTGERNAFRVMGSVDPWGQWLEVFAPGYQTRRTSLIEVLGPTLDLEHPRPGRITLARKTTADEPFREFAGTYGKFIIEPDGRFSFARFPICGNGRSCLEFGYLSKVGDEIVVHAIRHPGKEPGYIVASNYRFIAWGERLYFCPTEDASVQSLCRAGLRLGSTDYLEFWANPRESDTTKPRTGLPKFPWQIWAKFAFDEVTLRSGDNCLKMALGQIFKYAGHQSQLFLGNVRSESDPLERDLPIGVAIP